MSWQHVPPLSTSSGSLSGSLSGTLATGSLSRSCSSRSPLSALSPTARSPLLPRRKVERDRSWLRVAGVLLAVFGVGWVVLSLLRTEIETRRTLSALEKYEDTLARISPPLPSMALSHDPLPDSSYLAGSNVLIVQHNLRRSLLDRASERSHASYAAAWGYGHLTVPGNHFAKGVHASVNKMYVLRAALRRELESESAYGWVFYTDSDTLVADPTLPLHALLPPASYPAVVLGNEDHNGFNNGALLLRVHRTSLDLVEAVITAAEKAAAAGVPKTGRNDQTLMAQQLRWHAAFGGNFARLPKVWLNAYFLHEAEWNGGDGYQLQVHFVNKLKLRPIRPTIEAAANLADGLRQAAGHRRMHNARADEFARAAETYWKDNAPGIEGMRFLIDIDETVEVGSAYGEALPF